MRIQIELFAHSPSVPQYLMGLGIRVRVRVEAGGERRDWGQALRRSWRLVLVPTVAIVNISIVKIAIVSIA